MKIIIVKVENPIDIPCVVELLPELPDCIFLVTPVDFSLEVYDTEVCRDKTD